MFDYLEFQAFGPGEILDFHSPPSPAACMLQEQDHEEAGTPASCEHGRCGSGMEEQMVEGGCPMDHSGEGRQGHPHHPDDIKLHFHRAGPGSGGFLEGLFGCLRPVWNIIGKTYSTEYKLQQQG